MKPIFESLRWALTETAKKEIELLLAKGFDFDLAYCLIDLEVRSGRRPETELFNLQEYEVPRPIRTNC